MSKSRLILGRVRRRQPLVKGMLLRCCGAALFLLATGTMIPGAELPPIPKQFSASIGGFLGSSYQLELHGATLTYTASGRGHRDSQRATITPTPAQWREFREALDALKIWEWRPDYPTDGTVDGTQWALDIEYTDHVLKTQGSNCYPDATGKPNGKPESTKTFDLYLAAIKKLTGGKTFQ
jgi:hypothetical protein